MLKPPNAIYVGKGDGKQRKAEGKVMTGAKGNHARVDVGLQLMKGSRRNLASI